MAQYGNELVKIALTWTPKQPDWAGEVAVNTFHLQHQHFTGNTFSWADNLQDVADGVATKLADHWGGVSSMFGTGYQISQVTAFQLGTDGKTLMEKTNSVPAGTLVGTATNIMPPEVAYCMSLYGYVPGQFTQHRGRKRGRIYWPYIGTGVVGGNGKAANPQVWADAFAVIFNDIQGMHVGEAVPPGNSSDYMSVVVASGIDGSVTQVERLAFDERMDSQRRRQHQTPAAVHLATLDHS